MSYVYERELPDPSHLKQLLPVPEEVETARLSRIETMKKILAGEDERLLLIIGPCSADNEEAVLEYMHRLKKVQDEVADKIFITPRVYTNKPRTTGAGYKGMMHQPDPTKKPNAFEGIKAIRHMHIRVMQETGFVAADEMLYPDNYAYLDDVLGYVAVGARSVENQQHRLTCSGVDIPVGMKNGTGGDVEVMFNAIHAAQMAHDFIYRDWEVSTSGNPFAHAVLRGGMNAKGMTIPNYHFEDLQWIAGQYEKLNLQHPAIIVDTNHSNSGKKYEQQPRIVSEVMHSMKYDPLLKRMIKGFMVESYLEPGSQPIGENKIYGKSITDPCLGWPETEKLLHDIYVKL